MSGKLEVIHVEPGLGMDQIFDILENPLDQKSPPKTPEKKSKQKRKREEADDNEVSPPPLKMEMTSIFGIESCIPCKIGAASLFNFDKIKQHVRKAYQMAPTSLWSDIVRQFMFTHHKTTTISSGKDEPYAMDFHVGDLIMDYLVNPGQPFLARLSSSVNTLAPAPVAFSIDLAPKQYFEETEDHGEYVLDQEGQKILKFTSFMPDRNAGSKLVSTFQSIIGFSQSDTDLTMPSIINATESKELIVAETDHDDFPVRGGLILGSFVLEDQLRILNIFANPSSTVNVSESRFECARKVLPLVLMRRKNEWLMTKVDPITASIFFVGGKCSRQVAVHNKNYDKVSSMNQSPPVLDLRDAVSAAEVQGAVDWLTQVNRGFSGHPNHIFALVAYLYRRSIGEHPDNTHCSSFIMPDLDLESDLKMPQRSNSFTTVLASLVSESTDITQTRNILCTNIASLINQLQSFRSDIILS
jgi:hypothetical protein